MLIFWGRRGLTEGKIDNKEDSLFLFPTRALGPGSEGRGTGEVGGGEGTREEEASDVSNLYAKQYEVLDNL